MINGSIGDEIAQHLPFSRTLKLIEVELSLFLGHIVRMCPMTRTVIQICLANGIVDESVRVRDGGIGFRRCFLLQMTIRCR